MTRPAPDLPEIIALIDATWPAASVRQTGPFHLRNGAGGGNRVSAATAAGPFENEDIDAAEAGMRAMGQHPLFSLRPGDDALDAALAARGYRLKDRTNIYRAPVAALTADPPSPVTAFTVWPPLRVQREIWAEGGIGPARLAVMDRVTGPKTTLLGRLSDRSAGTVFVAARDRTAMIHALEIAARHRRQGLARLLTVAAALWARNAGAEWMTLLTTEANTAANALYTSLGMEAVGQYHYRTKDDRP